MFLCFGLSSRFGRPEGGTGVDLVRIVVLSSACGPAHMRWVCQRVRLPLQTPALPRLAACKRLDTAKSVSPRAQSRKRGTAALLSLLFDRRLIASEDGAPLFFAVHSSANAAWEQDLNALAADDRGWKGQTMMTDSFATRRSHCRSDLCRHWPARPASTPLCKSGHRQLVQEFLTFANRRPGSRRDCPRALCNHVLAGALCFERLAFRGCQFLTCTMCRDRSFSPSFAVSAKSALVALICSLLTWYALSSDGCLLVTTDFVHSVPMYDGRNTGKPQQNLRATGHHSNLLQT